MPQGAPDPLPDSIILGQFSGLKNTVSPERLTGSEFERAINVDIDDVGQVRRRRGYALVSTGEFHSIRTIAGKTYGVKDGTLGIIRDDYSFKPVYLMGSDQICYTEVAGAVYFSSPTDSGIIDSSETYASWGVTDGQGVWVSPVQTPTDTLGAISGRQLEDPPKATSLEAYNGRIYLAQGKTLWATELYQYNYVDRTKNFMQFEQNITLLLAMTDGLYVGTEGGLYFIKGILGSFQLNIISDAVVYPGSVVQVPTDLVHPQAMNSPMPTGVAAMFMTSQGVSAGFDGGTVYNLTHSRVEFPRAVTATGLFRQDSGGMSYIAVLDSAGGPSANARIGDYVDAEIIRASQGGQV